MGIAHNDIKPNNLFALFGIHKDISCTYHYANSNGFICDPYDDGVNYTVSDLGFAKKIGFESLKKCFAFYLDKDHYYLPQEVLKY